MKASLILAVLPVLASGLASTILTNKDKVDMEKPKKMKSHPHMAWMTATVEESLDQVQVQPSKAPFRPQFEILNTEHEVGHSKSVEVYWQRPSNGTQVKGIFFGATGCFHQGGDFFEQKSEDGWEFPGCSKNKLQRCQGLPENVYAFKYARERGYMVMTITPQGPNSCWDHKKDPHRLDHALKYVIKREGLPADIPMFATGASQGGLFLFDMESQQEKEKVLPNLKCIAPQCAAPKVALKGFHLPTMFVWMVKDLNLTNPVQTAIKKLKGHGVRVAERTAHPWKIQELMKARGYSNASADEMFKVLNTSKGEFGHRPLARNGHIIDHPGSDAWWKNTLIKAEKKNAVLHATIKDDSLMKDHSKLHHLMQAAYAEHEFTAEYTDHMIDFCEGHEDANRPLRFGREPIISGPSKRGLSCSPNCPMPSAKEYGDSLLQTAETYLVDHTKEPSKGHNVGGFGAVQKLKVVKGK